MSVQLDLYNDTVYAVELLDPTAYADAGLGAHEVPWLHCVVCGAHALTDTRTSYTLLAGSGLNAGRGCLAVTCSVCLALVETATYAGHDLRHRSPRFKSQLRTSVFAYAEGYVSQPTLLKL